MAGAYRTKLPVQRLIVAEVAALDGWLHTYLELQFRELLPSLNAILSEACLHQIEPSGSPVWEWEETTFTGASHLLLPRLRYGEAYGLEIRTEGNAANICDELLQPATGFRYFSNYEIDWSAGNIVDVDCVGGRGTEFTFEFAMFILSSEAISLFLSLDED